MNVVILLPTYNEKDNILVVLDLLLRVTKPLRGYTFRFLVVDDKSPDGTSTVAGNYGKTHKEVQVIVGEKEGLGKAVLRGMVYAVDQLHADIIVQMDADLSHNPEVIPQFIHALEKGANFVVGSRYIPGGSIPDNWGIHRKLFSVVGNAFVRFGLGYPSVHDWTGGFRAYRKEFVLTLAPQMGPYRGYVFQIAFLHKALKMGAHVTEVPIQFIDRKYGKSKISPAEYIRNIFLYVGGERLRELKEGTFGKFLVVGGIGFFINTLVLELMVRFGFTPTVGSMTGAELAILSNFLLNNAWTFKERKATGSKFVKKLIQFNTASLGAIVIQGITVAVGTYLFGVSLYRLYYIAGVGIGLVWNYVMYSRVIWKKHTA